MVCLELELTSFQILAKWKTLSWRWHHSNLIKISHGISSLEETTPESESMILNTWRLSQTKSFRVAPLTTLYFSRGRTTKTEAHLSKFTQGCQKFPRLLQRRSGLDHIFKKIPWNSPKKSWAPRGTGTTSNSEQTPVSSKISPALNNQGPVSTMTRINGTKELTTLSSLTFKRTLSKIATSVSSDALTPFKWGDRTLLPVTHTIRPKC